MTIGRVCIDGPRGEGVANYTTVQSGDTVLDGNDAHITAEENSPLPWAAWVDEETVRFTAKPGEPSTFGYKLQDNVRRTASSLTWDITADLDTGVEAISTWYYLYLIPDPNDDTALAVIGSTSASGPSGYSNYRAICSVYNNGSGNLLAFHQIADNEFCWAILRTVLTTTARGSDANAVEIDMAAFAPATASAVMIVALVYSPNVGDWGYLNFWIDGQETGSSETLRFDHVSSGTAYDNNTKNIRYPITSNRNLWYQRKLGAGGIQGTIWMHGWLDNRR